MLDMLVVTGAKTSGESDSREETDVDTIGICLTERMSGSVLEFLATGLREIGDGL